MRNFITPNVKSIQPSGIRKFFDIANEIEGVISLGVGEPDFDTPWRIREEGIYSLEKGITYYTSNAGLLKLRDGIADYVKRKYNLSYESKGEILVTVGGSEAIDLAFRSMITPGDEVIIPMPCYVSYEPCAILAGAKVVKVALQYKNQFQLTKNDILSVITDKTKILILNYPNNPTGAILDEEHLREIAEVCIEKDIFVISDEIYSELCYENKHISIASLPQMKERTIVINGFSKTFSMTGWRLGYACGPRYVIEQMTKIHQFSIMCAPTTSQYAALEALKNGDKEVENMKEAYKQRKNYVVHRLKKIGMDCFIPKGAFYVFPSIQKFGLTSEEFCMKLLKEDKIVVIPGNAFGAAGEGFVRISYAYSMDDLKNAFDKLEKFVEKF